MASTDNVNIQRGHLLTAIIEGELTEQQRETVADIVNLITLPVVEGSGDDIHRLARAHAAWLANDLSRRSE